MAEVDHPPRVATLVIGAGSWGTALASLLAANGQPTTLWGRDRDQIAAMAKNHRNERYLPGIDLAPSLRFSADLGESVRWARDLLLVVPSHVFRATLEQIAPHLKNDARLIWATKGFERGTAKLSHQIVREVLGEGYPTAVISGPTFAAEVARGMPTALTVASPDEAFASELASRLHNKTFRAYTSGDVIGVEVGGAVKNALAIAAGISDGLGFGANARAALITRGLTEVMRLGVALGGERETFMGLTGLGDLILTCTDDQSRNRRFGLALGKGASVEAARQSIHQVVEGIHAAQEATRLARRLDIEMPITEQVYRVVSGECTPREAVSLLLHRQPKPEINA